MGCGTNIVPGFDAVNKQVKDYPLEMKIMAEFNASESNKNYGKKAKARKQSPAEKRRIHAIKTGKPLSQKELNQYSKEERERLDLYQRMMNPDVELMQGDVDRAALNEYGDDIRPLLGEAFVGINGKKNPDLIPEGAQGERYYWFLYGGVRANVFESLLNWGRPTAVVWFNEASDIDIASYKMLHDVISVRNYASRDYKGRILLGDILRTLLHETFHWVDYTLGRHIYNKKDLRNGAPRALSIQDPEFKKAFFDDGRKLGITADKYGGLHDSNPFTNSSIPQLGLAHDSALAEIIFYEYMLDHPRIYERVVKALSNVDTDSLVYNPRDEMNKILKSIVKIPNMRWQTIETLYGTEWLGEGTMDDFIYESEVPMRTAPSQDNSLPSRNQMKDHIESASRRLTDAIEMNNVHEARNKLFDEVYREGKELGDRRAEIDGYMDILDAMASGAAMDSTTGTKGWTGGLTGHGKSYYDGFRSRFSETFANLGEAWSSSDRSGWNRIKEKLPNLAREFERIMEENKDAIVEPRFTGSSQLIKDLNFKIRGGML